jgi:predicted transcriptional regulator
MEFSQEELIEVIDRMIAGMMERAGVTTGPVDALTLADDHLGIPIEVVEPAEEDENGKCRPRSRGANSGTITLTTDMSNEQRQRVAADGIARLLLPDISKKVGMVLGSETKQFVTFVRGLVVPRVLIPTRAFRAALRECRYDVFALKRIFATASMEMIALRFLDLDETCVVSIVDDGVVATRRGNRVAVSKKLEAAEQECVDRIMELDLPQRARKGEWTAQGWPVPDRPFRRILLRAVPDDV